MPYFITDKSNDCSGWAVTKQNGDVIGCHKTKQSAIKQMVAVSLAEKMKPGGERALNDELEVGDFVFWENAGQTEFGLIILISTYGVVTNDIGATIVATQDRPIAKISIYQLTDAGLIGTDRVAVMPFAPLMKLHIQDHNYDNSPDHPGDHQGDNFGSYRIASGPQAVIVDIDDTLIHFDRPMKRVIEYVNQLPGRKYIITGRMQSDRERTISQLRDAGVEYSALFMKQADEPTTTFKKRVAERLLRRYDVYLAIDNDENNRRVFSGLGIPTMNPSSIKEGQKLEDRAVNANVPQYMRAAARRGLEYVSEGKGGDGLKQQTINEARKMAAGEISDDKWIRMAAWIARHLGDLDSPQANPQHPNYPSAGVVAHLLWGSGPSKAKARTAMEYAQSVVERIRKEDRHLPGKHNQKSHGGGRISSSLAQSVLEKVRANGGLSVNMLSGSEPTAGYMVAKGTDLGDIVSADDFYDEVKIQGILSNYFKKHKSELSGNDNYLGIWHNTEDGQVYLDVSQNILDRTEAIIAGQTRDQISIWDVVNFEEIGTGGTGDIRTNRHSEDPGHFGNDGSRDRSTIGGTSQKNLASKREAAERIIRHLPGKHSQKKHAGKYGKGASTKYPGSWDEVRRPYVAHQEQTQLPDEAWLTQNNSLNEREALAQSYEKFGYNDKPSVSTDEFEELKGKGATIVYRGYEKSDQMTSEAMTGEFRNSDTHYVGAGYFGNGTYVTENRDSAIGYSMLESEPGGSVMAMAIRPEAKFIHESNIGTFLLRKGKEIGYDGEAFNFLDKDPSQAAIFLGFDGIVRQHSEIETHYIILNRSAVVVPQFNEFV